MTSLAINVEDSASDWKAGAWEEIHCDVFLLKKTWNTKSRFTHLHVKEAHNCIWLLRYKIHRSLDNF